MQSVNLLLSHTIYVSFYILTVTFFLCVQLYAGQMDRKPEVPRKGCYRSESRDLVALGSSMCNSVVCVDLL